VVEVTASYEWFVQLVEPRAARIVLAHPSKLRVIAESTRNATVTNSDTGTAISNAALTLTEGDYQEVMQAFPTGDYVGAGERVGTYTLTATAPGFQM
jgi:hypothetical protein